MNRYILLILILLMSSVWGFDQQDISRSQSALITHQTTGVIDVVYRSPRAQLSEFHAIVNFIPDTTSRQTILDASYNPPGIHQDNQYRFTWTTPQQGRISISNTYHIKTYNTLQHIVPTPFPLTDLPDYLTPYLMEQPNIDITPAMRQQANEIVQGIDDLFMASHEIARWVESNVEYSLDTLAAQASLPASWVFEQRYGVCSELTLLFIALARSVGIPTRFVSGMAYSDAIIFDNKWNAHAWAEVYFPQIGWVPFDITYRQFGMIDPSHITMRYSADGNSSYTKYEWSGTDIENIDIQLHVLDFDTQIRELQGTLHHPIDITATLYTQRVGIGSRNAVLVNLHNPTDYYYSVPIHIATAPQIAVPNNYDIIAIPPHTTTQHIFELTIDPSLDRNYIYTIPVIIVSPWHETIEHTMTIQYNAPIVSAIPIQNTPQPTGYSNGTISCQNDTRASANSSIMIPCTITNTGTLPLDASVCIEQDCTNTWVGIGQTVTTTVTLFKELSGTHILHTTLQENGLLIAQNVTSVTLYDHPIITVSASYPESVVYGESFNVNITVGISGTPHDLRVILDNGVSPIIWDIGKTSTNEYLSAKMNTQYLIAGNNNIQITATFTDIQNNIYNSSIGIDIMLTQTPLWARIWLRLSRFLQSL